MTYSTILAYDKNIILYRPELNKITGNPLATVLLCQIVYWSNKYQDEEFYKNIYRSNKQAKRNKQKSWMDELGYNRYQIEKAFEVLISKKLVSVRTENSSHNTYVKLNIEFLEKLLIPIYTNNGSKKSPVVEGEQRELFPVVEGEQRTVVEGEQPPLPTFDNRSITETTQRLPEKVGTFLKKTFESDKYKKITEYQLRKLMHKLTADQKEKVKNETEKYMKNFPEMAKSNIFRCQLMYTYIKKQMAV